LRKLDDAHRGVRVDAEASAGAGGYITRGWRDRHEDSRRGGVCRLIFGGILRGWPTKCEKDVSIFVVRLISLAFAVIAVIAVTELVIVVVITARTLPRKPARLPAYARGRWNCTFVGVRLCLHRGQRPGTDLFVYHREERSSE
jgi:hypothetical protein